MFIIVVVALFQLVFVSRCAEDSQQYLLHNEANAIYEFVLSTDNQGADILSKPKKDTINRRVFSTENLVQL